MNSQNAKNFVDNVGFDNYEIPEFEDIDFEDYKFDETALQVNETSGLILQDQVELFVNEPIGLNIEDDSHLSDFFNVDGEEQEELPRPNASAKDVALWMKERLEESHSLYQADIIQRIIKIFGNQFSYTNSNGNPAIAHDVLAEFRKSTPEYKWSKSGFY
jgi:hypothetical protein